MKICLNSDRNNATGSGNLALPSKNLKGSLTKLEGIFAVIRIINFIYGGLSWVEEWAVAVWVVVWAVAEWAAACNAPRGL